MGIACGLLFLSCPLIICACSSVQISCNFLDDHAPVVFIGTVLPQTDAETIRILNGTAPVIFKVTAHVRGDVGEKVEVYGSGNSCDFSFKPGQSYLVFAYFASGHLVTSEASSTRLMLEAGGLLRQLQALKESRQSASLFGFLGRRNGANPGQPMPGVTIKAISGRRVATTTTAPDGSFEFIHLPPAEYRVKALLPKTFVPPPEG